MEEAESNLTAVGGRLGQSFSRLSAHINFYFRRKDIAPVVVTPVDQGRSVTRARKLPRKDKDEHEIAETASSAQGKPDLQLFHVSSLATAFGESYSYVANHINATFSRQFSQIPVEKKVEEVPLPSRTPRKLKRRNQQHSLANSEGLKRGQVKSDANQGTNRPSSSWEEGYRQFARHINRYFGAKVADEPGQPSERRPDATSQQNQKEAVAAPPQGLFHHSRHATDFGENYFQTASHINQYFKGATEEDLDGGLTETASGSFTLKRSVSFMDCLRHPTSAIPDLLGAFFSTSPLTQAGEQQPAVTPTQTAAKKQLVLSHREVEDVTRGLIGRLSQASSPDVLTACLEALNEHLVCHPACKAITWQEKTAVVLLKKRRAYRDNQALQSALRETLALIGYMDPVKGHGIRVLSIDGGAVLAFMLGLAHFSLEDCADMYRRFGSEVFRQNPLVGTVKMGWNHSYYDTEIWERILHPKAFVFRNYNHKPGCLSRYAGGSSCQMWQAVRASSAAPGYFQEFLLQSDIHQDGGIILNNPCSLAVHESRLLWPNQPFQCVLSLGTGRYDNVKRTPGTSTSLRAKISSLICSATDTEGVHTLLDDLLAPDVYFRFNPMLSALVSLDESRPRALEQLQRDTQVYLERNRPKLARLCLVLGAERSAVKKTQDWVR
ncbi:unnamed protein product, partial [Tetraodon nigroviridis]